MIITQIKCYRVELPLHEGSYKWSGGNSVAVFDSTVVEVRTDEGVTGYGEICPPICGPTPPGRGREWPNSLRG